MDITPTKAEFKKLPPMYATEAVPTKDKVAVIKFFGGGRGTWYAVEGRPEGDDFVFFGYVVSPLGDDCDEWGYFSLNEMQSSGRIERDRFFKPTKMSELFPDM